MTQSPVPSVFVTPFSPAYTTMFKLFRISIAFGGFKASFMLQTERRKREGSRESQELNSVCLQHHGCGNGCFIYPFVHASSQQCEQENPL